MAASSVPPDEVLLSKRVQEMVLLGEEPLGPYICRSGEDVDENEDIMDTSPIPIIDLNRLSSSTTSDNERERELEKLGSALSSWGCFQGIGHGISASFLDKIRQVSREFFNQPMEEKNKYAKSVVDVHGYGADPVPEQGQSLDWSDRLFLEVFPEDRRQYNLWPQIPIAFREVLEDYAEKTKMVTEITSKAVAKSLKLEENCFLEQFGKQAQLQARFNYYSPCQRPDLVLGLKPHADGTGYSIILQDEVGLQVLKDGKWYTVPKDPTALFVLMGDQMEIMSNGMFKAPVHRVLSNSERDRISVAMFYTPEVGKEIGPEDALVNEDRPRIYKKVKDYAETHWKFYQRGQRCFGER
ncbi:protein SRG1-like isoform X2 [Solanum dulcamara]|uniref:protein SRG1-like isoform X2 n=1 Tax=Solanum dulcamara TaxID=45834 RepID=UPI002486654A|nr:protein SRG1-like isoform X2 [Solanum dulcamara]